MKSKISKTEKAKITCIFVSIIITIFSLQGNIIITNKGGVSLLLFESYYVYIFTMAVIIYAIIKKKKANILIIGSLSTYLWTYFLINQMFTYLETKMYLGTSFYIYLSSALFLILSLFFNEELPKEKKENSKKEEMEIENKNIEKDNFLFTNIVMGIKGISLNTIVLLVNDIETNTINLIYNVNEKNQTTKLPISNIKNIIAEKKVKLTNTTQKVEENETKSMLLSAVIFGGNPIMQYASDAAFHSLFDSLSNNYDKVNYNIYYEIIIEAFLENQNIKIILNTDTNPEKFINLVSKNKI